MVAVTGLAFVFLAGLFTALATGLGALPFFVTEAIDDRWNVFLWGLASGIMIAASVFGLVFEGLEESVPTDLIPGIADQYVLTGVGGVVGMALVTLAHDVIEASEIDPKEYERAGFRKLVLIIGVLTVHSFPEGVAVGVAFADLDLGTGPEVLGLTVPVLGVFMTIAIAIHNVPEGVAISIPLRSLGVSEWRMVWWAVFSSLPQPVGAVIAFYFVRLARQFLPFGFGFAAGAMIHLVLTEFLPEARDLGRSLPSGGRRELAGGFALGVGLMVPLLFVQV